MVIKKNILISIGVILCLPLAYFFCQMAGVQSLPGVSVASAVDVPIAEPRHQYNWNRQLYTPLMNAARLGNIEDARALIAAGASLDDLSEDVDQSTESSNLYFLQGNQDPARPLHNTALHIAIYNTNFVSNFTIAQMLINAGANVRIANNDGDTPAHFMMQRIQRDGVFDQSHLTQREDVVDKSGTNTLGHSGYAMSATNALPGLSEREDLMVNLIAHGADINAQNNQGYTPLHIGVLDNEGQWIKTLTEKYGSIVDFNVKAFPSSCKTLTTLEGAPPTSASNGTCQCLTPMQLAGEFAGSCTGNSNIFYYFRDNKPKILGANERDVMGMTGLMLAVIWEGTQKLKNPNYDPSQDAHANFTVDKLLKEADDLNATVNCLRSPCNPDFDLQNMILHIALLHQLPDMIKKILEGAKALGKNINPNLKNAQGDAPLHYIFKLDAVNLKDAQERCARNKDSRIKAIQSIMNHGGDINIQNANGDTILHMAVKRKDLDLVKFILGAYNVKGLTKNQLVNLSIRNQTGRATGGDGKTALDLAKDLGLTQIVDLLVAAIPENQQLLLQGESVKPVPQPEVQKQSNFPIQ